MDEIVLRAMAKWPNVPAVYGWLALDGRGRWLIKGESIGNPGIVEFISRNYAHDERGRWYFQNGPQRVFVDLHYTPWVIRLGDGHAERLVTHTGDAITEIIGAWVDEQGRLLLQTDRGVGMVDDRDVESLAPAFESSGGMRLCDDELTQVLEQLQSGHAAGVRLTLDGRSVPVKPIRAAVVAERFGIDLRPRPESDEEACT